MEDISALPDCSRNITNKQWPQQFSRGDRDQSSQVSTDIAGLLLPPTTGDGLTTTPHHDRDNRGKSSGSSLELLQRHPDP